jgi:hypothetical protein
MDLLITLSNGFYVLCCVVFVWTVHCHDLSAAVFQWNGMECSEVSVCRCERRKDVVRRSKLWDSSCHWMMSGVLVTMSFAAKTTSHTINL